MSAVFFPSAPLRSRTVVDGMGFHGTTRQFARFCPRAKAVSGSATAGLGIFFSSDLRVAAHFTLRPHVINEGYAHPMGSRHLLNDPWEFDMDPFLPDAHVIQAQLRLTNPYHSTAVNFARWVEHLRHLPDARLQVARCRAELIHAGHDGVLVAAWNIKDACPDGRKPCLEFDADTWIMFNPDQITIETRADVLSAWV